jgi:hypothetical protein
MSEILEERSQDMVDLFAKEVNKYNLRYKTFLSSLRRKQKFIYLMYFYCCCKNA